MPFLIPLAQVIASAIVAAITAVAAAIAPVLAAVAAAVTAIAAVLGSVVIPVVNAVITGLTWFGSMMIQQMTWLTNWITTEVKAIYTWMSGWVSAIASTFEEILGVIHFKTILEVHNIVYIVSPQYREMMKKVYAAIGNASQALGLGPQFLTLAIQNTRNLVLDVTGMFGQKYDLGQVSWLATLNKYLDHFNVYAERYYNNPEAVFWDLAELIERPSQDAKGAFQQSMITGLQTALDFARKVGEGLYQIGIDIEKIYDDLPQFIKDKIPDPGTTFWDNFSPWLNEWYIPTVNALSDTVNSWQTRVTEAQENVSQLVEDLRRPGTIMAKVDTLGTIERHAQEDLMAKITNRRLNRILQDLQPVFTFSAQQLYNDARIPIPPPTVSPPLSYEPVSASIIGPGGMTPRNSWFVGDF